MQNTKHITIIAIITIILISAALGYLFFSGDENTESVTMQKEENPAPDIVDPHGFINTQGEEISLSQFEGEKVVLVDFWTYSCINCQRTLPYLTDWYDTYRDQGLEIVGIHTPEFAFEKKRENVESAIEKFGIEYPVVLDNEYATWRAFGNNYWPRKYLIDIHGNIIYDHIGEGAYAETEKAIQGALTERAQILETEMSDFETPTEKARKTSMMRSPEIYFGAGRNEHLGNGSPGTVGILDFTEPQESLSPSTLYLGGTWNLTEEYAESQGGSSVLFRFSAQDVYMVAASNEPIEVTVYLNGKRITDEYAGADVKNGTVLIQEERLYSLIEAPTHGMHTLKLEIEDSGAELYTFTFG